MGKVAGRENWSGDAKNQRKFPREEQREGENSHIKPRTRNGQVQDTIDAREKTDCRTKIDGKEIDALEKTSPREKAHEESGEREACEACLRLL